MYTDRKRFLVSTKITYKLTKYVFWSKYFQNFYDKR